MLQVASQSEVASDLCSDFQQDSESRPREQGRRWSNRHFVNLRLSVPFIWSRHYLAIVAGSDRRQAERRERDRAKHPISTFGNRLLVSALGLLTMLAAVGLVAISGIPL